jgi:uncharacterized protein with PQ loop repeat
MSSEYIGYIALTISVSSFLPVIYTVYKTGKTNNFPIQGLILAIIGNLVWFTYGIYRDARANIISGSIYFLMYSYIIYKKYKE